MKERTPNSYIICSREEFFDPKNPCYILTLHVPSVRKGVLVWREFYASSYLNYSDAYRKLAQAIGRLSPLHLFAVRLAQVPIFQDGLLLTSINEVSHEPGQSV